jgi:hypothetical protein
MYLAYQYNKNWTFNFTVQNLFNAKPPFDFETYGSSAGQTSNAVNAGVPYNPALHQIGASTTTSDVTLYKPRDGYRTEFAALGPMIGGGARVGGALDNDHGSNRKLIFCAEFEIAFVMRGHSHDCAGAIFEQDKIPYPDRQLFAVEGIHGVTSGEEADLFGGREIFGLDGHLADLSELLFGVFANRRAVQQLEE